MSRHIFGFVGPNGAGKTLCAVETLALPALAQGRTVYSNFVIDHPLWQPLQRWGDVLAAHDGVVLLDEVSAWVPSRESSKLPAQVLSHLNQLRKAKVTVGWTGPAWGRCDKALREVTHAVVWCRGYWHDEHVRVDDERTHRFPTTGRRAYDEHGKPVMVDGWSNRRLFRWRWFDKLALPDDLEASDFESPPKGVRPYKSQWYWRPAHEAHRMYDTAEHVLALDGVHAGTCIDCGGTRRAPKCECDERNARILSRAAS